MDTVNDPFAESDKQDGNVKYREEKDAALKRKVEGLLASGQLQASAALLALSGQRRGLDDEESAVEALDERTAPEEEYEFDWSPSDDETSTALAPAEESPQKRRRTVSRVD